MHINEIGIEYQHSFVSLATSQQLSIPYKEEHLIIYIWKQKEANMLPLLIIKIMYVTTTKQNPDIHLICLTLTFYEHHQLVLQNLVGFHRQIHFWSWYIL